jgi:hypothetical protein
MGYTLDIIVSDHVHGHLIWGIKESYCWLQHLYITYLIFLIGSLPPRKVVLSNIHVRLSFHSQSAW